ncbi:MAG: BON domain-containing protein [Labilithrix sp.]|nr:BON domain-containing protein [Labilithrix sp.]MCW5816087.1 BON domain-containing protein [Labilithrix sp.]
MKTTIAISVSLALALAACADRPPPRQPGTTTTNTTTTTSYPSYQQSSLQESTTSAYGESSPGAISTIGTGNNDGTYVTNASEDGVVHSAPLAPPPEPALNDPEAAVRPAQPGPANAKAPDGKSPTAAAATDQGNSKGEVAITARIRKALVASDTLSVGAKNVKVITSGTKVTLRGDVKTEAEKNEIEGVARNTDGVTEVENQLVVKK